MKSTAYLIFDKSGIRRMTIRTPSFAAGEFAAKVTLRIPDEFFQRVFPVAEIEIPEDFILQPEEIEVTLGKEAAPG